MRQSPKAHSLRGAVSGVAVGEPANHIGAAEAGRPKSRTSRLARGLLWDAPHLERASVSFLNEIVHLRRPSSSSIFVVHLRRPSSSSIFVVHLRRPSSSSIFVVHLRRPSSSSIFVVHLRRPSSSSTFDPPDRHMRLRKLLSTIAPTRRHVLVLAVGIALFVGLGIKALRTSIADAPQLRHDGPA